MKNLEYRYSFTPPNRLYHFSFSLLVLLIVFLLLVVIAILFKIQNVGEVGDRSINNSINKFIIHSIDNITPSPSPDHNIICSFLLEEELIKKQLVFYENNFGDEKVNCIYFSSSQRETMLQSIPSSHELNHVWEIYSSVNPHYEAIRSWIFGLWYVYEYGGWYVRFMEYLPNSVFRDKNIWLQHPTVWVEKSLTPFSMDKKKNNKHSYPFYNWSALYCRKRHHPAIFSLLVQSLSLLSTPEKFQGKEWPSPVDLSDPKYKLFFILFSPTQRISLGETQTTINNWSPILFPFRWFNQRVPNPCYRISVVYEYANKIHPEPVLLPKIKRTIPPHIYLTWRDNTLPQKVMENWKTLNPSYDISLYTDDDCYDFLFHTFSKEYADYFKEIPFGPIKADWWRICILYANGGIYVDADVEPLGIPFDAILHDCTSFTCIGNTNDHVFQAIMAFPAKDPILRECITLLYNKRSMVQNYLNQNMKDFYLYGSLSGTVDMYNSILQFFNQTKIYGDSYYIMSSSSMYDPSSHDPYILKLAQEGCGDDYTKCNSYFNTIPLFKSRYDNYVSEWMVHGQTPGKFL
jgi:hypothetical protein